MKQNLEKQLDFQFEEEPEIKTHLQDYRYKRSRIKKTLLWTGAILGALVLGGIQYNGWSNKPFQIQKKATYTAAVEETKTSTEKKQPGLYDTFEYWMGRLQNIKETQKDLEASTKMLLIGACAIEENKDKLSEKFPFDEFKEIPEVQRRLSSLSDEKIRDYERIWNRNEVQARYIMFISFNNSDTKRINDSLNRKKDLFNVVFNSKNPVGLIDYDLKDTDKLRESYRDIFPWIDDFNKINDPKKYPEYFPERLIMLQYAAFKPILKESTKKEYLSKIIDSCRFSTR